MSTKLNQNIKFTLKDWYHKSMFWMLRWYKLILLFNNILWHYYKLNCRLFLQHWHHRSTPRRWPLLVPSWQPPLESKLDPIWLHATWRGTCRTIWSLMIQMLKQATMSLPQQGQHKLTHPSKSKRLQNYEGQGQALILILILKGPTAPGKAINIILLNNRIVSAALASK